MFAKFLSVGIVLLVITSTKFCRRFNFWKLLSVLPAYIIWNGNIFPSNVFVKVNVMLCFFVLLAKPTRVEIVGVIVVHSTINSNIL